MHRTMDLWACPICPFLKSPRKESVVGWHSEDLVLDLTMTWTSYEPGHVSSDLSLSFFLCLKKQRCWGQEFYSVYGWTAFSALGGILHVWMPLGPQLFVARWVSCLWRTTGSSRIIRHGQHSACHIQNGYSASVHYGMHWAQLWETKGWETVLWTRQKYISPGICVIGLTKMSGPNRHNLWIS